MSIVLDVILVAIFAAYVILAAKKGFVRTLLELVAVIAAVFLAFQISPVVAQGAYDGLVEKQIVAAVDEQISENVDSLSVTDKANAVLDSIPEFAVSFASSVGIEISDVKNQIASQSIDSENLAQSLVEKVAEPIVVGALTVILFLLLAAVLIVLLKLVAKYVSKLFDIPIVKSLNQTLGGVLGAIKGVLVLLVICTGLRLIFGGEEGKFAVAVNDSFVVGLLDKINPMLDSLKEIVK